MKTISIAYRSIFRNKRRSLMTIVAICVSASSLLFFGGFVSAIMRGVETGIIMQTGHIHIYKSGYTDFGAGNPAAYGIDNYEELIESLKNMSELSPYVREITQLLFFSGIVGNYEAGVSNTFFGIGVEPSALKRLSEWNAYNIKLTKDEINYDISDDDIERGIIGYGLARMLRLNALLEEKDRIQEEEDSSLSEDAAALPSDFDFLDLVDLPEEDTKKGYAAKVDLLAATASGAPNVVNLYIDNAEKFSIKIHDDNLIMTNIKLAQSLVYGQGAKNVTAVVIQLNETKDLNAVKQILSKNLPKAGFPEIEIKTFDEIRTDYGQIVNMFITIFGFVKIIMIVIIVVTLLNTMSMSVMERYNEIGTLRALGVRKLKILYQFVSEGLLLGIIGSVAGVIISVTAAYILNSLEMTWIPPNYSNEMLLSVHIFLIPWFLPVTTGGIIIISGISSILPAYKAAKMNIVDALRYN